MKLRIRHTLTFHPGARSRSVAHLLLTPGGTSQQKVESWSIEMPGIEGAALFRDGFGNRAHLVTQAKPEAKVSIVVSGQVETFDKAGVLGRLDYDPVPALFRRVSAGAATDTELTDGLASDAGRIGQLHELMGRIHDTSRQSQSQDGQRQSQAGAPVNQAEAFIGAARSLGIPARFVWGYLFDGGKASVHNWAEAWDDGLGWIGFDPQLNVCPTTEHIRMACGLDAGGTPPIRVVPSLDGNIVETLEVIDQDPSR